MDPNNYAYLLQKTLENTKFALDVPDVYHLDISMPEMYLYVQYGIRAGINYGSQLGASIIMFFALLLLTKTNKRNTLLFSANLLALLLNIIRNALQCAYFTGHLYSPLIYFTVNISGINRLAGLPLINKSHVTITQAGSIINLLLLIVILTSLVLQMHVVCLAINQTWLRFFIILSTACAALVAVSLRCALTIQNFRAATLAVTPELDDDLMVNNPMTSRSHFDLASATNISISVCICFFCLVFVGKLGITIRRQMRMGFRTTGEHWLRLTPIKKIFIMSCQTMILPAIFSILQYFSSIPELSSQVLTIVASTLPLSTLWAAAETPKTPASTPFTPTSPALRTHRFYLANSREIRQGITRCGNSVRRRLSCLGRDSPIHEKSPLSSNPVHSNLSDEPINTSLARLSKFFFTNSPIKRKSSIRQSVKPLNMNPSSLSTLDDQDMTSEYYSHRPVTIKVGKLVSYYDRDFSSITRQNTSRSSPILPFNLPSSPRHTVDDKLDEFFNTTCKSNGTSDYTQLTPRETIARPATSCTTLIRQSSTHACQCSCTCNQSPPPEYAPPRHSWQFLTSFCNETNYSSSSNK